MSIALRNRDNEYRYFAFQSWQPDEVWCSLTSPEQFTAPQVRQFFWQKAKERILTDLQPLIDDGWQPADPVGPDALKVRRSERVQLGIDPSDVFLWIITLGAALFLQLLLDVPRRYTTYRPVQFRVRLQRRRARQLPNQVAA